MATPYPSPSPAEIDVPAPPTTASTSVPPVGDDQEEEAQSGDGMTALERIKTRGVDLQKEWTESPEHPQNWPDRKRWTIALVIALTGFLVRDLISCRSREGVAVGNAAELTTGIELLRVRPTRPSLSPTSQRSRTGTTPAKNSQLSPSRSTWSASAADHSCLHR